MTIGELKELLETGLQTLEIKGDTVLDLTGVNGIDYKGKYPHTHLFSENKLTVSECLYELLNVDDGLCLMEDGYEVYYYIENGEIIMSYEDNEGVYDEV